jgi:hypothetical protein
MKSKKLLLIIVLNSLIIPCLFISFSKAQIAWQVSVGQKLTWTVTTSEASLGLLPVNSRYEMTITSINDVSSTETELYVNLSAYNSQTQMTTPILTNQIFSTFDSSTNTTTLYTYIDDHCFLIPPAHVDGFVEGLESFYSSFFTYTLPLTTQGIFTFSGYDVATDLLYMWTFKSNYIADNLVIVDIDFPEDFLYWLVLKTTSTSISAGYFYLVFLGLSSVSLIYIFSKKIKVKS